MMQLNFLLLLLILVYTFPINTAIECRICKRSTACLFNDNVETYPCENDDDLCYSWFSRQGDSIDAQRGCLPITSPAYSLITTITREHNHGCAKGMHAADCFALCSTDLCN